MTSLYVTSVNFSKMYKRLHIGCLFAVHLIIEYEELGWKEEYLGSGCYDP